MIINAKTVIDYGLLYDKSNDGLCYAAKHINCALEKFTEHDVLSNTNRKTVYLYTAFMI